MALQDIFHAICNDYVGHGCGALLDGAFLMWDGWSNKELPCEQFGSAGGVAHEARVGCAIVGLCDGERGMFATQRIANAAGMREMLSAGQVAAYSP